MTHQMEIRQLSYKGTSETAVSESSKSQSRLFFLDNIRIFLTITVIFHHAAIAYGGVGDWGIQEAATDNISPILLTLFNAVNQSYFMSAFFLFAGYFTPRSLEKKGIRPFLTDRLIRLGVPIAIYTTLIINLNAYILNVYVHGIPYQIRFAYEPGHLWFLQVLLFFALIYATFKVLIDRFTSKYPNYPFQNAFPSDKVLLLAFGLLTLLTFLVRLQFPVGDWFLRVQPAHFVHYIFSFIVGVLAYRGNWFQHLPRAQARRWGWIALSMIPCFFVLFILGGALEGEENIAKFLGGWHWQSFSYAIWETVLLLGVNIFLLYFFRQRFNRSGSATKFMTISVFTVYIIHQTVLYAIQTPLLQVDMPSIIKFFIAAAIAVCISFILSIPIRKLPYAKRILG